MDDLLQRVRRCEALQQPEWGDPSRLRDVQAYLRGSPALIRAGENEDGNNPSYGFGGAMTTIAQGNPYPVLYGEREIGGAVESGGVYTEDQL